MVAIYEKLKEQPKHVPDSRVVDFDLYDMPLVQDGWYESLLTLKRDGRPDIVWTPYNEGHWIVTSARAIKEVLADHRRFSNRVFIVPKSIGEKLYFAPLSIDPPDHHRFRMPLNEALWAPKVVARLEPQIRETVRNLVVAIEGQGQCDFVSDVAEALPMLVFMRLVNLPMEDANTLRSFAGKVSRPSGKVGEAEEGLRDLTEYLARVVDERMGKGGDDLLATILNRNVDGRQLSKSEAIAVCTNALFGGLDTLLTFLGFAMAFLAQNPSHRAELVRDSSLLPRAMEELFRRFSVGNAAREVVEDCELDGVQLKKGEMVLIPLPLAGLDETENQDPLKVDFHRKSPSHAAFGQGIHFCPGANLARLEVRILLEEWFKKIPDFSVPAGCKLSYSGGVVGKIDGLPLVWSRSLN